MIPQLFALRAGGFRLPDFAHIADDHWAGAFDDAMAAQRAELERLATDATPPDLSLIHDWELSDDYLTAVSCAFWTLKDADTNDLRDQTEAVVSPKLAAHEDATWLDRRLYDRLVALQARIDAGEVPADEQDRWWLSEKLRLFRRNGIELDEASKARLRAVNEQIAACVTTYSSLVVKGRGAAAVVIDDAQLLAGLSDDQVAEAKRAAEQRGQSGWVIELVNTTRQPILASLDNRETRRAVFEASVNRGKGAFDTRETILELIRLRVEKAQLLGFDTYAAYIADDGCAKTSDAVMSLLTKAASAAAANAAQEAQQLQAQLDAVSPGATLEPWDWAWLAEKTRRTEFDLDEAELSQYLEFEAVLERGVFAAAGRLYGLTFHRIDGVAGYTNQCRAYEVRDGDGSAMGLVLFDPYARASKQGGAWMTSLTPQSQLEPALPVVTNNCNQTCPQPGQPSLMDWDQVTTLFHEFGHDLHGLLAATRYPSLSGTQTPRDFVEFPSQVNEMWSWEPSVIAGFATHVGTGEPMPAEMCDMLLASRHFGEGFNSFESYAAMLLDQVWHQTPLDQLPATVDDIDAFEQAALERFGMDNPLIPPRYKSCYFSHIWGGSDYAASYYGYLWAEVMDADTVAWFAENGGLTRQNGDWFRSQVLSRGGSEDVMTAYRRFRGADPDPVHVFARHGLA